MANRNGGFIGTDGLDAPDPPTAVTPTAGSEQVSVAFTAPTDAGTSAITGFVVQVSTNDTDYSAGSNTGTSSPIVVSSLTNDTAATAKVWAINAYGTSAPSDASASFTPALTQIGLFLGGGNRTNVIDKVVITTTGNASDFGDLTVGRDYSSSVASSTRGVTAGGLQSSNPQTVNVMDYVTIASAGDSTDFGDLLQTTYGTGGCSSSTRGVFGGGVIPNDSFINVMQYITIASTGNSTDFGDTLNDREGFSGCGSATRGIFFGARYISSGSYVYENVIQYITIGSTGNSTDFGDLTAARVYSGALSSSTRGVNGGGGYGAVNVIDYVTIASTGDASDFGDLTVTRWQLAGAAGTSRGLFGGGNSNSNVIDYITIASTGNAQDFGDLSAGRSSVSACSNAHGGL